MKKILLLACLAFSLAATSQPIADTGTLRTFINTYILTNGTRSVTGAQLNRAFNGFLNSWPNNKITALSPLSWNSSTRTLSLPGWNASNWNSVYNWFATSPLAGYVPTARTLTINGVTYDLSANRTYTISAAVAPNGEVVYGTGSGTVSSSHFKFGAETVTVSGNGSGNAVVVGSLAGVGGLSPAFRLLGGYASAPLNTAYFQIGNYPDDSTANFRIGPYGSTNGQIERIILGARQTFVEKKLSVGKFVPADPTLRAPIRNTLEVYGNAYVDSLNDHTGVAKMATVTDGVFGIQTIPSGGGGSYTAGPGISIAGSVISNDLFFKGTYFRNSGTTGSPVFYQKNDSSFWFRKIVLGAGLDSTGSGDSSLHINLTGGGGGGGGTDVLASGNVTGVSTVDIDLRSFQTYDVLVLELVDFKPSGNGDEVGIRVSSNAGSTYNSADGDYYWETGPFDNSGASGATTDHLRAAVYMSNAQYSSGFIRIYNPGSTSRHPKFVGELGDADANGHFSIVTLTGWRKNDQKTDFVRLYNVGGGTVSCKWILRGIVGLW